MYLQSTIVLIGIIVSRPNKNWPKILSLIIWFVYHTAKAYSARIPIHGSAPSMYVSHIFYVCVRRSITWCILYVITFACGFSGEFGLYFIPYSSSLKLFFKSRPMNSDPWSYLTSTGQGYLVNHVFYTMSKTVIAFLSLYCVTYNHPVTGPIILKSFNI